MKKAVLFILSVFILTLDLFCQQGQKIVYTESQQKLRITTKDIKLIRDKEKGGYHLYVKKLPGINSVLLTETTKDPEGKNDSYAYRAKDYNPVNGDEIRVLDGKTLVSEGAKYSLVDSTPEKTDFLGMAFHIYIPDTIIYGYDWSRNGEITIGKGTFINIRTYEKPYADYSGNFMDSPFMFDFIPKKTVPVKKTKKLPPPLPVIEETVLTDDYNPVASEKFKELSGDVIYSKGPETIISDIHNLLKDTTENLDVVFCIDATGSMKNDIDKLKKDLQPELKKLFREDSSVRVGLLFYRDYGDTYKYMNLPVKFFGFTTNLESFNTNLNSVKILGTEGGDIPEAVYEAMYAASMFYDWRDSANKKIILIGDAEPHPTPRGSGKYSKDYVMSCATARNITVKSILLPKD